MGVCRPSISGLMYVHLGEEKFWFESIVLEAFSNTDCQVALGLRFVYNGFMERIILGSRTRIKEQVCLVPLSCVRYADQEVKRR